MADSAEFKEAAEKVKKLKSKPADDELLALYALFKQATVGDCDTARPGLFDLKGKAKWDAWNGKKGLSKEDAAREYCQLVEQLVSKYGLE